MKIPDALLKSIIVLGLGAVLAYFGLDLPRTDLENVADTIVTEIGINKDVSSDTPEVIKKDTLYKVDSMIDGDTLAASIDGQKETIRVLGINTPETKYSDRGAECYGQEASTYAKELLQEGSVVMLTTDPTQDSRDKYNRILAYVTLPDGRDFGQVMIADGFAYEYTFKGRTYEKQTLYKELQTKAQKEAVGLWSVCYEEKL